MIMLSDLNEVSPELLASDFVLKSNLNKKIVTELGSDFLSREVNTFRNIIRDSILDNNCSGTYYKAKSTIVISGQGSGKSTLTGILGDELKSANIYSIAVVPTGLNTIHMRKHGFYAIAGKKYLTEDGEGVNSNTFTKNDLEHFKIAVTPDSLHKVLKVLNDENCLYVIHLDELHNTAISVCFRKIFSELRSLINVSNCLHVFGYTATPGPLLNLFKYNNVLEYTKNKEIIDTPVKTFLMKNSNAQNKAELIRQTLKTIDATEVLFVYLSNKTQHLEVLKQLGDICNIYNVVEGDEVDLETKTFIENKSGNTIDISADTKGDSNISKIIRRGEVPSGCNLVLTTSIASSGIEFTNTHNATILTFCTRESFNLINEIQFSRRNRNKIKQLLLAVPDIEAKWEITNYNNYREKELLDKIKLLQHTQKMYVLEKENPFGAMTVAGIEDSIDKSSVYERMDRMSNKYGDSKLNNLLMYYQAFEYDINTGLLKIKYDVLENIVWDSYTWNMLKNPKQFTQIYMQKCYHFKFTKEPIFIKFEDVNNEPPPTKKVKDMTSEEKEKHKESVKLKKKEKAELLNKIKTNYRIEDIISALDKEVNIVQNSDLYNDLDALKKVDKTKFNSVVKKVNELNTFNYKALVWDSYLRNIGLNKIFEQSKNNEEKQKIALNIIDDYYCKDKNGYYSRRNDLRLMPIGTFVHFIICSLDYFANQDKRTVNKKVRISTDVRSIDELKEFHNYLCVKGYYKKDKKNELLDRLGDLEELVWLVFNAKNGNRISSIKK